MPQRFGGAALAALALQKEGELRFAGVGALREEVPQAGVVAGAAWRVADKRCRKRVV